MVLRLQIYFTQLHKTIVIVPKKYFILYPSNYFKGFTCNESYLDTARV
jgi:hypothetical protein